jgi:class 3 adenylate cyclase
MGGLSNFELNPQLTKQHLKAPIFKSYILYVQHHYPHVNINEICVKCGLPLEYLLDENNWVSIVFERDFMGELRKIIFEENFIFNVGKYGVKPKVMGRTIHFLCTKLLSLGTVYEKLPMVTSLLNKVISLKIRSKFKNTIVYEVAPITNGLTKHEKAVLITRLPDFIESARAYYSAIPLEKNLPPAKVDVTIESVDDAPVYAISVKYPMEIATPFRMNGMAVSMLIFITSVITAVLLRLSYTEFFAAVTAGAVVAFLYLAFMKLSEKNHAIQQTLENLALLDGQYQELHQTKVDLSRKLAESSAINQIIERIVKAEDEHQVLMGTCELLATNLKYDRSVIFMANKDLTALNYASGFGLTDQIENKLRSFSLKIDIDSSEKNKISNVFRLGESILIEDVKAHIPSLVDVDSRQILQISDSTSFCAVPIMTPDRRYGVLIADSLQSQKVLSEEDLWLLTTVSSQIAVAVEKIRSRDNLKDALEKTERMKDSYSRFVPFETLKKLDYNTIFDVKLGDGVEKNLTILFSDIRSFSSLCENMTSSEVLKFLNSYFGKLSPIIKANNGTIDKFIGDCIMAIFENADDALAAAIQIQRELIVYNIERRIGGRQPVYAGIGICDGPVILGPLGFEGRLEITVLSDTVNIASRLDGLCKDLDAKILVAGVDMSNIERLPDGITLIRHGMQKIKGRNGSVEVFELVDNNILDSFGEAKDTEYYIRYKEDHINHLIRKLSKLRRSG